MPERLESAADPVIAAAAALSTQLGRAQAAAYQVESGRLVEQALAAGRLRSALLVEPSELAGRLDAAGIAWHLIAPKLLGKVTGTSYTTSLDAVGIANRELLPAPPVDGLILACESIQDPRNVGVLIRTAEATGTAAVLFSDDSADPFSRGAVRSSTGSIVRQPLHLAADLPATLAALRRRGVRVLGTSARAPTRAWDVDWTQPVCLVVGNESTGLSARAKEACDELVSLPVHGAASSLNVTVAAGALLYEALRPRR